MKYSVRKGESKEKKKKLRKKKIEKNREPARRNNNMLRLKDSGEILLLRSRVEKERRKGEERGMKRVIQLQPVSRRALHK